MESSVPPSSLPLLTYSTESEDVHASPELAINSVEAKAENPSKEQRPDVHCTSSRSSSVVANISRDIDSSSVTNLSDGKPLHLLQGPKGTHLVVPRAVLRELNETKRNRSLLFRRQAEIASSALDWIEECKVNTKWWIQLQSLSKETKNNCTSQSSVKWLSHLVFTSLEQQLCTRIRFPTSEDQVLQCALLYQNRNIDEKLVLLCNDVTTLKIKAMAEDVI